MFALRETVFAAPETHPKVTVTDRWQLRLRNMLVTFLTSLTAADTTSRMSDRLLKSHIEMPDKHATHAFAQAGFWELFGVDINEIILSESYK